MYMFNLLHEYTEQVQITPTLTEVCEVISAMEVGDKVQKGKIICIIEAMKLMDEIEVRSYCTDVNLDASVDAMEVAGEE
ncbi:hypothetical protein T459_25604 [Capsicum annuum]|uniref:Biotin carboxyl carrier protein of acetyl-CoA carboxylase n=1 Tax=Capsicum annuum TaxID=4072 RepID=A0A2G2YL77_CAPAN|nr:hypothetical protein T459_25604 [Capsicum annuum]